MLRITPILGLAALFTPGFVTTASADVVDLSNLNVTLNGSPAFTDTFSTNQVLAGGTGTVLPSGLNYSGSTTPASYLVIGTVRETGSSPTVLNTAEGGQFIQTTPGSSRWSISMPSRCCRRAPLL